MPHFTTVPLASAIFRRAAMGACCSRSNDNEGDTAVVIPVRDGAAARGRNAGGPEPAQPTVVTGGNKPLKDFTTLKWKSDAPVTKSQLVRMREAFWDTQPAYSGRMEIWQALKLACEAETTEFAQAIIDSAGITVPTGNFSDGCYDELGNQYIIPNYCIVEPVNLVDKATSSSAKASDKPENVCQKEQASIVAGASSSSSTSLPDASSRQSSPFKPTISTNLSIATKSAAADDFSTPVAASSTKSATPSSKSMSSTPTTAVSALPSISITLRLSTGTDLKHTASLSDTVSTLKTIVMDHFNTNVSKAPLDPRLKIVHLGKPLDDAMSLSAAGIRDKAIVQVFVQAS